MTNFRTLALTALSGGLIAIGSSMALAQSANNSDNTSPGISGHGTGCSNAPTSDSGAGTGGDTNCMDNASKQINNTNTNTYNSNGTMDNSSTQPAGGTSANNPDNTT